MTLRDFFLLLSDNPEILLFFFIALPLTAILLLIWAKDDGSDSPWKYFYSTIIYLSTIPGIFAITLSCYMFLFERRSVLDANVYTQILPVISMALTLWIIRKNVSFDEIPGFEKISGLLLIIGAILVLMWIADRMFLITFISMPFYAVILIFAVLVCLIVTGSKRLLKT